jgi:hypothetical protein
MESLRTKPQRHKPAEPAKAGGDRYLVLLKCGFLLMSHPAPSPRKQRMRRDFPAQT